MMKRVSSYFQTISLLVIALLVMFNYVASANMGHYHSVFSDTKQVPFVAFKRQAYGAGFCVVNNGYSDEEGILSSYDRCDEVEELRKGLSFLQTQSFSHVVHVSNVVIAEPVVVGVFAIIGCSLGAFFELAKYSAENWSATQSSKKNKKNKRQTRLDPLIEIGLNGVVGASLPSALMAPFVSQPTHFWYYSLGAGAISSIVCASAVKEYATNSDAD